MAKVIVAPAPGSDPGWIVDTPEPDALEEPIARRRTLREAVVRARIALVSIGGGELEICGPDGRVRGRERLG